ncbi:hypothetical protein FRB99_001771 [Tulasnella sp. 403]|nr:hypothetical protein FRB99_001771 [Tulasnella sp. 403]
MAHNERPGPLPPNEGLHGNPNIPRMYNRFAKRDPALYPLAAVMTVTLGLAGWFVMIRKPTQVEPKPGTLIHAHKSLLHDAKQGSITLEDYQRTTTGDVPEDIRAANTIRREAVPVSDETMFSVVT